MTTVKLGDFVTVVKEGQSLLFKVTKFDNEHVWGALVVDRENKKCRKGRPSKIALKDVKSTAVQSRLRRNQLQQLLLRMHHTTLLHKKKLYHKQQRVYN